tara:strand:+ start:721 stop:1500 length:780 start_codon:yes stop_codon:yes gene_type:complete
MNSVKLNIAKLISKGNKIARANFPKTNGRRILMYHSVSNPTEQKENNKNIYKISEDLFYQQMLFLKSNFLNELRKIEFKDFSDELRFTVNITFDDGYKDNLRIVAPIMEELKIPFTVFITTDYLESSNSLYLDKNDLRELASMSLVEIGSHSLSHTNLTHLNDDKILHEITSSKLILEDIIGDEVHGFSYPYGGVSKKIRDIVEESGYIYATNSCFALNRIDQDRFMLGRNEIWNTDTISIFHEKMSGYWDWLKFNHKY